MPKRSAEDSERAPPSRWTSQRLALAFALLVASTLTWLLVRPSPPTRTAKAHAEPVVLDGPAAKR